MKNVKKQKLINNRIYKKNFENEIASICKNIIGEFSESNCDTKSVNYSFTDNILMYVVAQTLSKRGIIVSNVLDKQDETIIVFIKSDKLTEEDDIAILCKSSYN